MDAYKVMVGVVEMYQQKLAELQKEMIRQENFYRLERGLDQLTKEDISKNFDEFARKTDHCEFCRVNLAWDEVVMSMPGGLNLCQQCADMRKQYLVLPEHIHSEDEDAIVTR